MRNILHAIRNAPQSTTAKTSPRKNSHEFVTLHIFCTSARRLLELIAGLYFCVRGTIGVHPRQAKHDIVRAFLSASRRATLPAESHAAFLNHSIVHSHAHTSLAYMEIRHPSMDAFQCWLWNPYFETAVGICNPAKIEEVTLMRPIHGNL